MREGIFNRLFTLSLLVTLFLSGCAVSPSEKYRDANASDAARQAAGRPVAIPRAEYAPVTGNLGDEHGHAATASVHANSAYRDNKEGVSAGKFGVEYRRIRYESGSLQEGRFYSLYAESNESTAQSLGFSLTFGQYDLPVTGIVGDSISAASSFSWAVYTKFFGDDFSFIASPYLHFSYGYGIMYWRYRQPIIDSSGYSFTTDALEYMEFKSGLGGELGRYGPLQLSAYFGPVARVYLGRTHEGFNNDLFEDRLDITWSGMIGFGF